MLICRPKHLLSFVALSTLLWAPGVYAQDVENQTSDRTSVETESLPETSVQNGDVIPSYMTMAPIDETVASSPRIKRVDELIVTSIPVTRADGESITPKRFNKMRPRADKKDRGMRVLNRRAISQ